MKISERILNDKGEFVEFPKHLREKAQREGHYQGSMDVERPCEKAKDTLTKPHSKRLKDELNRKAKEGLKAKRKPRKTQQSSVSALQKGKSQ